MARRRFNFRLALAVLALAAAALEARAGFTIVFSRPTFLADPRVVTTASINFDDLSVGTDLTNQSVLGVTFVAPGSTPLQVILGSTGVRFPMSPSSGFNVLSPGGTDPSLESDDLSLTFASPVQAFGVDVVFDAPDGFSFVGVSFFDAVDNLLGSNGFIPSPVGAPGFQFVGGIADSAIISRVVFDDFDGSPTDDNVAYDSLVFSATTVPEPSSMALLCAGGLGLLGHARRRLVKRGRTV